MKKTLLTFAVVMIAAWSVSAQDYAIKLNYPLKADQQYKYTASGTETTKNLVASDDQTISDEKSDSKADLASTVTVIAVDSFGRPTKESHTIETFSYTKDGNKKDLLSAGAKVVAFRQDSKMAFEVDGKEASSTVSKALERVIDISAGGPPDDEIFGTKERKKVGDSWSINEEAAKKSLEKQVEEGKLKVEKISGKTTLQKVTRVGDSDVVHLAATMNATVKPEIGVPVSNLSATMTGTMTGAIPADQAKGTREESMEIIFSMKGSMKPDPSAPTMKLDVTAKQTISITRKLLK